jgi:ankyrin repeat protein
MSLLADLANAIENGDSSQIESLLANGSIDVNARLPREFNPPPLVYAVRCNASRVDIVERLLSAGARIDDADDNGETACFAATQARERAVLAVLLAHRPNLEAGSRLRNSSPLRLSLSFSDAASDHISLMLINAGASLDVDDDLVDLVCEFASRSTAAIQALRNRHVIMNRLFDRLHCTPLHLTARRQWSAEMDAVVNMLIHVCGIDLDARDANGNTPCHFSVSECNDKALRCFINAGADVNCVDFVGRTPLHTVCELQCTILLLAAGADVKARDCGGQTPLQVGVIGNVMPAFVAAGADPDDAGELSVAARNAHRVEIARRAIAKERLDFVRHRAMQVCVALQSRGLDALQMCEILQQSCGPLARLIEFHQWWKIATTVKHFHHHRTKNHAQR